MSIKSILAAIALMAASLCVNAQTDKSNAKLSEELKHEINILNADIKALKARKKADPANESISADIEVKQEALKVAKERKSVIDNAIKASDKASKETKEAETAQKKNEKAGKAAESLKSNPNYAGKSNELLVDELDAKIAVLSADVKALKARKNADKTNASIVADLKAKEIELKELKRNQKVFKTAVKASKQAVKETDQAEKAQRKHEKAHEKAENMKSEM